MWLLLPHSLQLLKAHVGLVPPALTLRGRGCAAVVAVTVGSQGGWLVLLYHRGPWGSPRIHKRASMQGPLAWQSAGDGSSPCEVDTGWRGAGGSWAPASMAGEAETAVRSEQLALNLVLGAAKHRCCHGACAWIRDRGGGCS